MGVGFPEAGIYGDEELETPPHTVRLFYNEHHDIDKDIACKQCGTNTYDSIQLKSGKIYATWERLAEKDVVRSSRCEWYGEYSLGNIE